MWIRIIALNSSRVCEVINGQETAAPTLESSGMAFRHSRVQPFHLGGVKERD
jgi:hypothetical protein